MRIKLIMAAAASLAMLMGTSVGQRPPAQTREQAKLTPPPVTFRPPYRVMRDKQDVENARSVIEDLKRKKEAEIKAARVAGPSVLVPGGSQLPSHVTSLTLSPGGPTTTTPGCEVWLTASLVGYADIYDWYLYGPGVNVHLGKTYPPWVGFTSPSIQFPITAEEYGSGNYSVHCDMLYWSYPLNQWVIAPFNSNTVNIQFTGQKPNLHSVSLNVDSVKGGSNGTDPVMTVTLDKPAPPCGQTVYLSTSNSSLAWIYGSGFFVIPPGQQSDHISWFVGTKNVFTTGKSVHIEATVNGQTGVALLKLTK